MCCFENRCSVETLEVLQTLFWKLMRGDVRTVTDLTVAALRGTKEKPCGLVHLICSRRVMIKTLLSTYPDDHVLVKVFGCMETFNSFFPSERQVVNSIRTGKSVSLDCSWKLKSTTSAETALADICEKIYQGNFDDDLRDKWKDLRSERPTFEQLCDACSKLADATADVKAATSHDN